MQQVLAFIDQLQLILCLVTHAQSSQVEGSSPLDWTLHALSSSVAALLH